MTEKNKSVATTGREWGSQIEVIELSWVCLACGYIEKIIPQEEGTPARSKECPVCGAMMHRMNAFETFHLGFTDKTSDDFLSVGFKVVTDPPLFSPSLPYVRNQEVDIAPPIKVSDIVGVKVGVVDSVYHFVSKGSQHLKERFETLAQSLNEATATKHINNFLKSEAILFAKDGDPFGGVQYGVFGVSDSEIPFEDRYAEGHPFTLTEGHQQQISLVSDNNWTLKVRINESILDIQPKAGFPFDKKQISASVFEDFVRRYRNLEKTPGNALAFLKSSGTIVAVNGHPRTKALKIVEGTIVRPSNPEMFKNIIRGLNARNMFWEGDCDSILLQEDVDKVTAIVKKIDEDSVVETTATAAIDPGFVVRKDMYPNFGKFEDVIKNSLNGKVAKINIEDGGSITFEYEADNTLENRNEAQNLMIRLGDPFPTILHENGKFHIKMSISLDQINFPTQTAFIEERIVNEKYRYTINYLCNNIFEKNILEQSVKTYADMIIEETTKVFDGYRVKIALTSSARLTNEEVTSRAKQLLLVQE